MRNQSCRVTHTHIYTARGTEHKEQRKQQNTEHKCIYAYRTHPTEDEKRKIFKNPIHTVFFLPLRMMKIKDWKRKKLKIEKGIATKMSSIISFFSASHFKDRIWRIYSSESLKHSWDVLKSMLQARQTELESHYHQDSNCLYHLTVKCQKGR